MMRLLIASLLLLFAQAWVTPASSRISVGKRNALFSSSSEESSNVELISLESLTDHEKEGQLMAESIARWLDAEWMPQKIHAEMGQSAKKSYIASRTEGDSEMMGIMMRIADDLEANWFEKYDAEAFNNPWDVANYVSDYLTQKSGAEGCECNSQIY